MPRGLAGQDTHTAEGGAEFCWGHGALKDTSVESRFFIPGAAVAVFAAEGFGSGQNRIHRWVQSWEGGRFGARDQSGIQTVRGAEELSGSSLGGGLGPPEGF